MNLETFIQIFVNGESLKEKSQVEDTVDETKPCQLELDLSREADIPQNQTFEDYQYFDSDFDKLLSSSHGVSHLLI